ncbi:PAS domain S-box protein, partial [bacterium]|nr:PAS domain S-box protein [bacterium]
MLKQYKEAIEKSNIISKTDTKGIITFVNDEFCKISGYSKEELLGKNHNIVRHPDVPSENFKFLWDT